MTRRAQGPKIVGVGEQHIRTRMARYVVGCAIGITPLSEDDHFVDRSTADYRRGLNFPVN